MSLPTSKELFMLVEPPKILYPLLLNYLFKLYVFFDKDNRRKQFRKIHEMDEAAEFSEDDVAKFNRT
jgi:hypothetical protein